MPANHANKSMLSDRVKETLEQAQHRLAQLEEEAQKVVTASRKEITNLLQRLNAQDLLDRNQLKELSKEWTGKARHMGEDVGNRIDELRERVITFTGVASRDQVDELARDLDKLSRKLDRFINAKAAKAPKAKVAG